MRSEENVPADGGRTLHVVADGDPDGLPVVLQHGTPGNGSLYPPDIEVAHRLGIKLITYDRPGYGDSSSAPGRTVADCVHDVEAIADALGLERLGVWGVSGGGPHALACGALLPDRVVAVAALAPVAPPNAEGLDWTAGMGADNVAEFEAALRGRDALVPLHELARTSLLGGTALQLEDELRTLLTPVDAAALTGEFAKFLHTSIRNGLRDGIEGWVEDDLALFGSRWGFDVREVGVPVLLWHGEHDRFVPIAHGRWLVDHLPDVEPRLTDEDGHLTVATRRADDVYGWLADRLRP